MKKGIGIIGCGTVAKSFYLPMLKTYQRDRPSFFYDNNPIAANAAADATGGKAETLENLITQCEWICITSPPHTHKDLLLQCTQPGKKILCEKPFLLSLAAFDRVANNAAENKTEVYAAHVRRMLPAVNLAKKFVKLSLLGKLMKVEAYEGGRLEYVSRSGYLFENSFGGVMADTGSHVIDSILYMLGWDEKEMAYGNFLIEAAMPEPSHEATIQFVANTVPFGVRLSRKEPLSNKIKLQFEKGSIEIPTGLESYIRISRPDGPSEVIHAAEHLHSWEDVFSRQFYHLFEEGGTKLRMPLFKNLTAILEGIMKGRV